MIALSSVQEQGLVHSSYRAVKGSLRAFDVTSIEVVQYTLVRALFRQVDFHELGSGS
jgi:hypothetical protein